MAIVAQPCTYLKSLNFILYRGGFFGTWILSLEKKDSTLPQDFKTQYTITYSNTNMQMYISRMEERPNSWKKGWKHLKFLAATIILNSLKSKKESNMIQCKHLFIL